MPQQHLIARRLLGGFGSSHADGGQHQPQTALTGPKNGLSATEKGR
jgi:hypothetical protein